MKKTLTKILILGAIFMAAVGAIWLFSREEEPEEVVYSAMEQATLPVVSFGFEGQWINLQRGYTGSMDVAYIRDGITPLPANRKMTILVETYGTEVLDLGFEVRTVDGERLIERAGGLSFSQEGTALTSTFSFSDLLEQGKDYLLAVRIKTEKFETISYYTRVRYYEGMPTAQMLAFAKEFSEKTFDDDASSDLRAYLESSASADNDTLGTVTIQSSFHQVTWGNLAPVRLTQPHVTLNEIDETTASITLEYTIAAEDENGVSGTYRVEEDFCLRKVNNKIYLMDYERAMDQNFDLSQENMYHGVVELGVVSRDQLPLCYKQNETYGAFAFDGELWEYNNADNSAVRVFSFKQENDDGVRTYYNEHDFQIVYLGENGNLDFLVYGYMNRGPQEGQCGLAFYRYNRKENVVKEIFFIPSDKPFSMMEAEVSMLSYIGTNELLYFVFDNSIYAIDFNGMEPVRIVTGLKEGSFAISADHSRIAWQEEESVYGCKAICVMYLEDGKTNRILAPEGEYIRALGFIGGDFIYGFARERDLTTAQTLSAKCPMYALEIVDRTGKVQIRYEQDNVYLQGILVENDRVLLRRVTKDGSGQYADLDSDSLILHETKEETEKSPVSVRKDEKRQRVYLLNFAAKEPSEEKFYRTMPKQVIAGEEAVLELRVDAAEDPRYFGYAGGELVCVTYTPAEAIGAVYGDYGVVTDAKQQVIWKRLNISTERQLHLDGIEVAGGASDRLRASLITLLREEGSGADAAASLSSGVTPMEILQEVFPGKVIDLEGCSSTQLLYYLDRGHPVLALTEGTKAELIMGYDLYNLHIYNPLTGQTYKMARDDAKTYYENFGNVFVTIIH